MKRSVIALLLIVILSLSGCKAQQDANPARPAEAVKYEVEQQDVTIVPNNRQPVEEQVPEQPKDQLDREQPKKEQPKEEQPKEEQPKEEQPKEDQPKEEQPTDQPSKKEQPTEEEPEKDDPEIVKFWETVPEMSIDEATAIVKAKFERIKSEEKLGTLTDEERMAFYVLNSNFYMELCKRNEIIAKYPQMRDETTSLTIQFNAEFDGDKEAYLSKYSWENEPFAQDYFESRKTRYEPDPYGEEGIIVLQSVFSYDYVYDIEYMGAIVVEHLPKGVYIWIDPLEDNQKVNLKEPIPELHRDILRHYLSLKSVAFVEGPAYWDWDPVA